MHVVSDPCIVVIICTGWHPLSKREPTYQFIFKFMAGISSFVWHKGREQAKQGPGEENHWLFSDWQWVDWNSSPTYCTRITDMCYGGFISTDSEAHEQQRNCSVRNVTWMSANGLHLCKWTEALIQVTLCHLNKCSMIFPPKMPAGKWYPSLHSAEWLARHLAEWSPWLIFLGNT